MPHKALFVDYRDISIVLWLRKNVGVRLIEYGYSCSHTPDHFGLLLICKLTRRLMRSNPWRCICCCFAWTFWIDDLFSGEGRDGLCRSLS